MVVRMVPLVEGVDRSRKELVTWTVSPISNVAAGGGGGGGGAVVSTRLIDAAQPVSGRNGDLPPFVAIRVRRAVDNGADLSRLPWW